MREQFLKNCSPWEGPTLEKLVKDSISWLGPMLKWGKKCEEGVGEMNGYELPTTSYLPCAARQGRGKIKELERKE